MCWIYTCAEFERRQTVVIVLHPWRGVVCPCARAPFPLPPLTTQNPCAQKQTPNSITQLYTRVGADCITLPPTTTASAAASSSSNASAMEEEEAEGQGEKGLVVEKEEGEGETAVTMMEVAAN